MPKQGISLLPEEVEKVRLEEARAAFLRRLALGSFIISLLLAAIVFGYSFLVIGSSRTRLERKNKKERSRISSEADVELKAYDLSRRFRAIQKILAERAYFSLLLTQLQGAIPPDVTLTEMVAPSEETITISGTSRSYPSLARFLLNLRNGSATGSGSKSLFRSVELRSVSLDKQSGAVKFDVSLKLVEGGLRQQ